MCVVSNIGDTWARKYPYQPPIQPPGAPTTFIPGITRQEFDALKAEVENLKTLLKVGKAIDAATGQPDCEMDEKVELIKRVAEAVGVDLEGVFG